ncbi:MAG: DUF4145 domain-containing protein [Comamonas sp.]
MNNKYLTKNFIMGQEPRWHCPSCDIGILKLVNKFLIHSDAATQKDSNEEWFEPEYSRYVFTGILGCENCSEFVVVTGVGNIEEYYDEEGGGYDTILTPKFFQPPLKIINPNVSSEVPPDVMMHLEQAFQIFWSDSGSCVNRLRTSIEYLLDGLGVTRINANGGRLALAHRINQLSDPKHLEVKDALNSIRHMGNDGSHGSIDIEREELLQAFSVVNYCMQKLYPNISEEVEVMTFVNKVNQQKGFREKNQM